MEGAQERPESTAAILCLHCRVIDIICALWKLGGFRPGEAVFCRAAGRPICHPPCGMDFEVSISNPFECESGNPRVCENWRVRPGVAPRLPRPPSRGGALVPGQIPAACIFGHKSSLHLSMVRRRRRYVRRDDVKPDLGVFEPRLRPATEHSRALWTLEGD